MPIPLPKFLPRPRAETIAYLKKPITPTPLALILAAGLLYQLLNQSTAAANLTAPFIVLSLLLVLLRAPGWLLYLSLFVGLAVQTYYLTQIFALTPVHLAATRDRAAIATAQALSHGLNPWNHTPQIPVPATTGAASIVFVLPFVKAFGNIALLTYLFWLTIFGFVAICDLKLRNRVFPPLAILVMTGVFGFAHTMEWRLEELYFPYVFFLLAYYFLRRGRFFVCGLFLAVPPLWRVSYCFMVMAFLLWSFMDEKGTVRQHARIGAGVLSAAIAILLPFIIVGRGEFWSHNFYTITQVMGGLQTWPTTNVLFRVCAPLTSGLSGPSLRLVKEIAIVLLMVGMAWSARRRIGHPFWHIAIVAFLSHTLLWHSPLSLDYALIFMVPAYLAAALTPPPVACQSGTS